MCTTQAIKRKRWEKQPQRQYEKPKLPFSLTNSVTSNSWLHIFKSSTDLLHLKFGSLTFLPHQPHSGGKQRRYVLPVERQNFTPAVSPTQPVSQLLLQCMQESFHFLCRHPRGWCKLQQRRSKDSAGQQCAEARRGEEKKRQKSSQ